MNRRYFPLVALALAGCQQASPPARAQLDPQTQGQKSPMQPVAAPKKEPSLLDAYLRKPEPAYKWSDVSVDYAGDGTTNLKLVSQTWQGRDWTHRLQIFKPKNLAFPDAAVIYIAYGDGSFAENILGQGISDISGAYEVNLFNEPNQPLYGKEEDALIAYSFQKYLETGDASWPLLLPMTKAVTKAMDALQEWSQKTTGKPIKRFVITGASKRGWTAYLAAASDKRIVGAAPIVYNNLNIPAQIKHQKEVWGRTSDLAVAFSDLGLMDENATGSQRGQELLAAVDPYSYLDRLTMPILSINATNDGYWPHDAQSIYRDELGKVAPLSTYYAPNASHFLGGEIIPLAQSAASWTRLLLSGQKIPTVEVKPVAEKRENFERYLATTSGEPSSVTLWQATNGSRDFRKAIWKAFPMQKVDGGWAVVAPNNRQPFTAAFAQAEWPNEPAHTNLVLSSPLWTNGADTLTAQAFQHHVAG